MRKCEQCNRSLKDESPLVCQLYECTNVGVVRFRATWARYMNGLLLAQLEKKFDKPTAQ